MAEARNPSSEERLAKLKGFGPYRLKAMIEERDLLVTYRATDSLLGRAALVRGLAPSIAVSDKLRARIRREAQLIARAQSPGVVTVFEVSPEGTFYAVRDPEGPTLREVLTLPAMKELSMPARLELCSEISKVLSILPKREIVHGAINSGALFFSRTQPIELFGFERARSLRPNDQTPAEEESSELGIADPAYESPEQLVGEAATYASDVFSFAVVACELLTGQHPFRAIDGETRDLAHRIRTEKPHPIAADLGVPIEVERLLFRALGKSPVHRPTNLEELHKELSILRIPPDRNGDLEKLGARIGVGPAVAAPVEKKKNRRKTDVPELEQSTAGAKVTAVIALCLLTAISVRISRHAEDPDERSSGDSSGMGDVKVLAHPWAEVWVDGQPWDTTPVARPVHLSSGKHNLVFKHPKAPEEKRVVEVHGGSMETVEVTMNVEKQPIDAGVDASP